MKPREIVLEQIQHRETDPVPYTLSFEEEVGRRLDERYGGEAWRDRLASGVPPTSAASSAVVSTPL